MRFVYDIRIFIYAVYEDYSTERTQIDLNETIGAVGNSTEIK